MSVEVERPVGAGSRVPFAIMDPSRVPVGRYSSAEFAAWERDKLWPHVWQMACRLEEIPRVGDYTEYRINDQSILIVRESAESIRAYFNACRHRATALGTGAGSFRGGQIVCPYHGWRWNLDGSNSYVYAEGGFAPACLDPENLRLRECQVGTLFGMVFVNMDPKAAPLAEAMSEIAAALEPIGFDRMRVRWWRHITLPANWKMAQEAFMEAYHVMQAHPSLSMGASEKDYNIDAMASDFECFADGSAHALPYGADVPVAGMSATDYFTQFNVALYEGTDSYTTDREMFILRGLLDNGLDDADFVPEFFKSLYKYAQGAGIPLPPPATNTSGYAHIFPNVTVLPAYGNSIVYRARPNGDDAESCIFEVWSVQIPAAGDGEPERPELEGPVPADDWPQILKEDFYNVTAQQKGVHNRGTSDLMMSQRYEAMIVNSHRAIDEYLARY